MPFPKDRRMRNLLEEFKVEHKDNHYNNIFTEVKIAQSHSRVKYIAACTHAYFNVINTVNANQTCIQ